MADPPPPASFLPLLWPEQHRKQGSEESHIARGLGSWTALSSWVSQTNCLWYLMRLWLTTSYCSYVIVWFQQGCQHAPGELWERESLSLVGWHLVSSALPGPCRWLTLSTQSRAEREDELALGETGFSDQNSTENFLEVSPKCWRNYHQNLILENKQK